MHPAGVPVGTRAPSGRVPSQRITVGDARRASRHPRLLTCVPPPGTQFDRASKSAAVNFVDYNAVTDALQRSPDMSQSSIFDSAQHMQDNAAQHKVHSPMGERRNQNASLWFSHESSYEQQRSDAKQ